MLGDFPKHALRVARVAAMTVTIWNVLAGALQIALLIFVCFINTAALLKCFIFRFPTREAFMMVSVICSQSGSD